MLTCRIETIKKKNKAAPIKPHQIKSHMWIFVNAMIENPSFDSQTKETLTLKSSAFGSRPELSEDFIKKGEPRTHALLIVSRKVWHHRQCPVVGSLQARPAPAEDRWAEKSSVGPLHH